MRTLRNSVLGALFALNAYTVSAAVLYIQPIQVCDDDGTGCANAAQTLFEAEGDKIWAQAGIDLTFLAWTTVHETDYTVINNAADMNGVWNTGANANAYVVSMYFVNQILYCGAPVSAFGCATLNGNRALIANNVFTFNGGIGRLDTIAHELGHNLGLDHRDDNAADYLMTSGGSRIIPTGIGQIVPDGPGLDKLSAEEIAIALQSDLLVPEPATILLTSAALAALALRRRYW